MSTDKIIACDLGTSQCKVSVFDTQGRLLESATEPYETDYKPGNVSEQEADVWWQAFVAAVRRLCRPEDSYLCIALTGQMSACLPVDGEGNALRPAMIWSDQRAIAEADAFETKIGRERLYRITGNPPSATYTGPKILWMKNHERDLFDRTAVFLQPKDFIALRLTDAVVTDFSDASCTSLFDLQKREWDRAILSELDLPAEKLPPAVPSTEIIGTVTAKAAKLTGIQAGTPVVIGGGDGPTAAVGAGVTEPGSGYVSMGSSAWMSFCQPQPLYDSGQRTFNYCHLVPGMYALTGTMQSAGSSYAWCIDTLFTAERQVIAHLGGDFEQIVDQQLRAIPPGAEGLIFLPYLLGERTPYWNPHATGAFIGLRPHHRPYHLLRAVLESIAFHLHLIQEVFAGQGVTAEQFTMIGGGSQNELLLQICSDVFQKPLLHGMLKTGATSFGAAIAGAVGVGVLGSFSEARAWLSEAQIVHPDPRMAEVYLPLYEQFQVAYRLLEPLFQGKQS